MIEMLFNLALFIGFVFLVTFSIVMVIAIYIWVKEMIIDLANIIQENKNEE